VKNEVALLANWLLWRSTVLKGRNLAGRGDSIHAAAASTTNCQWVCFISVEAEQK